MGVLLMLMTICGLTLAVILVIAGLLTKRPWLVKFATAGVGVWALIYTAFLLGFSLTSSERTLALNEAKRYCGFYLDCHMHSEVTAIRTAYAIGDHTAKGLFYVVNVKVYSDARNPNIAMRLIEPKAVVLDQNGTVYDRDLVAESALPTGSVDLGSDIHNYQTIEKDIVFDLPSTVKDPRLDITDGYGIDKVIESVLVDDEDSILHKRTYFRLSEQTLARGVE